MVDNKSVADICRFTTPITVYIAGPTKSGMYFLKSTNIKLTIFKGKTSLARRMALQADYLFGPSRKVIWCYAKGTEQKELFNSLAKKVKLIEGFPRELIAQGKLFKREDNGILFLGNFKIRKQKLLPYSFRRFVHRTY